MAHPFRPDQQLTVTNPDYMIFEEVWTVVEVAYPVITFSCWRRWVVDKEYVLPTSTDRFSTRVVSEDEAGCLMVDVGRFGNDAGYRVEANEITYLDSRMLQWYLDKYNTPSDTS